MRDDPPTSVDVSTWVHVGPGEPPVRRWRVTALDDLARQIRDRTGGGGGRRLARPWVVAVDGRSGSGKTTFARRLAAAVAARPDKGTGTGTGVAVVSTDDIAWHHAFFDWSELLIDGVLGPLRRGASVDYRPPAWIDRGRGGSIVVDHRCPVVIVEGVGAAQRDLMPWLDGVIWVQSERAVASRRGILRDGLTVETVDFWFEWERAEIAFLADQRPWTRAELVVSGTPSRPLGEADVLTAPGPLVDGPLTDGPLTDVQATVWVVTGPPGAGKTTTADVLATALPRPPAVLDKDTLFNGFTEQVLQAYGRDHGEREGAWYDAHVKVHEYAALAAATRQIRGHGCPVLLQAPFTMQIRDPRSWAAFVETLGGPPVQLVWVRSDAATLHRRLTDRGDPRDAGKLAGFEAFIARIRPDRAPSVPCWQIDNRDGAAPVREQIAALLARP